jgi:creatinine amidohydrolase
MPISGTRRWEELTSAEAARLPPDTVAILPFAATEQHGAHLPLGTDAMIGRAVLGRALELLPDAVPALALPELAVGHSPEHTDFPGTLSLAPETLLALGRDLAAGVHRAGVTRIVLFNSHGGNPPVLELLAIEMRMKLGMLAVPAHWWRLAPSPGLFGPDEAAWGIHGGAVETSVLLHAQPDLVRGAEVRNNPSAAPALAAAHRLLGAQGPTSFAWAAQDLNPSGVVGDAGLASAEAGAQLVEDAALALAQLIGEVHRLPADALKPPPRPGE